MYRLGQLLLADGGAGTAQPKLDSPYHWWTVSSNNCRVLDSLECSPKRRVERGARLVRSMAVGVVCVGHPLVCFLTDAGADLI